MIDRSEELVTVFGGGGFIGRYVCEFLLKNGVRIRIAQRNPRQAYFIQPLAQVGQIGFEVADITKPDDVRRVIRGASAIVNLCGVFGSKMRAVHVDGARNVAEASLELGASALVQVSAMGASVHSESTYGRTKAEGEEAVRATFKPASIIRPSLVFGPEDNLTNRFAAMANLPFLPVIAARRNFQPVYVRDLADAVSRAALDPKSYGGRTYEVGGPQVMSMEDLHRAILAITGQNPDIMPMPDLFGNLLSRLGWLPGAPLTRDQWMMLRRDYLPSGDHPGFTAFRIEPTPLAAVANEWLGRFHGGGKFSGRRIQLSAAN